MDFQFLDAIKASLTNTFNTVGEFLPKLFSALIILLVGYIIAKIIKWAAYKLLKTVKFDSLADKVGVNSFLAKGGLKTRASGLMAKLVYWIIMFTTLTLFFDALGLEMVTDLLKTVIAYIPNILISCVLLIVGMYLAEFVSGIAVAALKGGDFTNPELVGRIIYFAVMFFVVAIVLDQLGIGQNIIQTIVTAITGGAGLAFAIAFGWGGKDKAKQIIESISNLK